MISPEDKKLWCKADYKSIELLKQLSWLDAFCDEIGNENLEKPRSLWITVFTENNSITTANITLQHDSLADIALMLKMGFKEGFTMGLGNLDELLTTLKQKK